MNHKDVERAIYFATTKHSGQTRRSEVMPYIIHPMEVMKCLYNGGITEPELLIAAVLHDVLEDTKTEPCEIENGWGSTVLKYVQNVSKTGVDDATIEEKVDFLKELVAKNDIGSCLLKLADRHCNILDFKLHDKREWFFKYYSLQAAPLLAWFYKNIDEVEKKYGQKTAYYFEDIADEIAFSIERSYKIRLTSYEYETQQAYIMEVLKLKGEFFKN